MMIEASQLRTNKITVCLVVVLCTYKAIYETIKYDLINKYGLEFMLAFLLTILIFIKLFDIILNFLVETYESTIVLNEDTLNIQNKLGNFSVDKKSIKIKEYKWHLIFSTDKPATLILNNNDRILAVVNNRVQELEVLLKEGN